MNAADGSLGPVFCSGEHDSVFVAAQVDYSSSIFVYALAPLTQELYVFRTSNLLTAPIAATCVLETKIPLRETTLSQEKYGSETSIYMRNLKGGLVIQSENDRYEGELVYYNMT